MAANPQPAAEVEFDGVKLQLSRPQNETANWIGQQEILRQLVACWLTVDQRDLPLTPRLIGPPGIGKTALGMAGAKLRDRLGFSERLLGCDQR